MLTDRSFTSSEEYVTADEVKFTTPLHYLKTVVEMTIRASGIRSSATK